MGLRPKSSTAGTGVESMTIACGDIAVPQTAEWIPVIISSQRVVTSDLAASLSLSRCGRGRSMHVIADAPRERGSPGWKVLRRTARAGLTIPLLAGQIWKTITTFVPKPDSAISSTVSLKHKPAPTRCKGQADNCHALKRPEIRIFAGRCQRRTARAHRPHGLGSH